MEQPHPPQVFGVRNEDLVQLSQQGWPGKAVRGRSGNTRLWGKTGDTSEEANSLQKGQIRANREGTAKYGDILRVGSEKEIHEQDRMKKTGEHSVVGT